MVNKKDIKHLLHKVKKSDVCADPFPHLVIKNAIDEEVCSKLVSEFPYLQVLTKGYIDGKVHLNNQKINYTAAEALKDPAIPQIFKEFIQANLSEDFFKKFIFLFKEHILKIYPSFEKDVKPIDDLKFGIYKVDDFSTADILINIQIAVNTPVINKPSSVVGIHVDSSDKLFTGLFYLRLPGDDSKGGNLEVYAFKDNKKIKFYGSKLSKKHAKLVKTVEYEKNTLFFFLDSIGSLHAVSPRSVTRYPRCLIFLTGLVNKQLYDFKKYQGIKGFLHYNVFGKILNTIFRKKISFY